MVQPRQGKKQDATKLNPLLASRSHDGIEPPDDFQYNHVGLSSARAELLLKEYGLNQLPEHVEAKWLVFLKLLFCAPMPIMIWIAIIIEAGIQNWLDMVRYTILNAFLIRIYASFVNSI